MNDLELAVKLIQNKARRYTELYKYVDGEPTLKFSTERLERAFGKSFVYFGMNWASIIINSVLDRLVLKGYNSTNDIANRTLDELFSKLNMSLDARDVHEALQVTGEAFLIVDMVNGEPELYFNDPRLCEVIYDSERPKLKRLAAKKWSGDDGRSYVSLYYPDRTENYVSDKGNAFKSYKQIDIVPNPLGIIPVFHFRNSRRNTKGELDLSTTSILDAINKLFGDLMVAAEFEAFKMRVFISQVDPGDIEVGPDMKLWLPANENGEGQNTSIQEIGGSTLDNFTKSITDLANTLAVTTRTPKSYLMNSGSSLSGEALIVEESALVKKIEEKQEAYTPTWIEVGQYLLTLLNVNVNSNEISLSWDNPSTHLPVTDSTVVMNYTSAGMTLPQALLMIGEDQNEIDRLQLGNATLPQ